VLYILEGEGFYQQEGRQKQMVKKGDVIIVPPDTKHWNGATGKNRLIHISISDNVEGGHVKWFSPVTEREYLN
jgi:quercetin dioxygenase-like cupin family protein